ncbi:conserved hypothetical protein [uncultured Desulfatiglans sp.]|uniref:N-acetyltransferase domain-containing protein n=1 Tax=Uncultured Desulfatiglans sp. TaxID=1748965 RepID=A0A653AEE6_UNCDX|nr:conserved hypothetical protein [uncultured Desulfatiglans sp.]
MGNGELTVGIFQPEDAAGVGKLFTEVYGNSYPAKIVYHPDQLIEAFNNRDNIPIVVRTPENRVVGYSSLFRAAPNEGVYEKGNGAVAMDFQNAGVMGMIFQHVREILPDMKEIKAFFGEAVCNHIYIQKAALAHLPFIETAIEIDLMPAEAYEEEKSASGRVSTLVMFITVVPKPHAVHIPEMYKEYLEYIYEGFDDQRFFSPSEDELPSTQQTRLETQIFDSAQVARVAVQEAGLDFAEVFAAEEQRILSCNVQVIQAWVNLSWPWVSRTVVSLREKGYFLGGMLPQWFGEDGLLMQKSLARPNWEGIHLFSERAKTILEFVKSDWEG